MVIVLTVKVVTAGWIWQGKSILDNYKRYYVKGDS